MPCCRHCGHDKVNRPRGLCWTCYHVPGVKELYPPLSKFAQWGVKALGATETLEPTAALPGTPEKVEALIQRAEVGERLWHERDAQRGME